MLLPSTPRLLGFEGHKKYDSLVHGPAQHRAGHVLFPLIRGAGLEPRLGSFMQDYPPLANPWLWGLSLPLKRPKRNGAILAVPHARPKVSGDRWLEDTRTS